MNQRGFTDRPSLDLASFDRITDGLRRDIVLVCDLAHRSPIF